MEKKIKSRVWRQPYRYPDGTTNEVLLPFLAVLDKQWVKRGKEASRLRPQSGASWGSTAAALLLLARCREREVWHSAPKAERLGAKNEWLDI